MTDFRFDLSLSEAERRVLIESHGETAVRNHAVFLANFHRVHSLFPRYKRTEAELLKLAERPD